MATGQLTYTGFIDPQSPDVTTNLRGLRTLGEVATLKASGDVTASYTPVADYNQMGALLTPQFEREIRDIARRRGVFGQLLDQHQSPAVGHPHRWFEQRILPNNQGFTDPRTISVTASNNGGNLRTEHAAYIRAMSGQINFGLFDQQTVAQTSVFPQLVAKDLQDMLTGLYQQSDFGLFTGNATSLTDGTSVQYCSVPTQITNTIQVNPGASIIDAIRSKVAQMMANQAVVVKPTHIFLNPLLIDLIEQEIKAAATTMRMVPAGVAEVVPGVTVTTINTIAGALPLVPAWEMSTRASSVSGATTDYPIMIVTMDLIDRFWIGSPDIQLYKLGLVSDLADKYVAVKFDSGAVVRFGDVAHCYGWVSR